MPILWLDFETYSDLDIKQVGVYRYAMHPSTEVLLAAYALDRDPVKLWVPAEGKPIPNDLAAALEDPAVEVHAFSAPFERLILWHVLRRKTPIERFRCTMVHAWSLSFSGGLAQIGEQMGLAQDKRKLAEGSKLIHKFCKPAPKNHKLRRYRPEDAPDDWQRFEQYCVQDVIAEREIEMLLAGYPMPPDELDLWFWDQEVNDRGVPVDMGLVDAAVKMAHQGKHRIKAELTRLTGLENPNSNPQLVAWLNGRGLTLANMQEETLSVVLEHADPDELLKRVIYLKLQISKTSTTKWEAFQRATGEDGHLRGMFAFGGAQRTQRWSGRIVQLQNLKSPEVENIDQLIDVVLTGDLDLVHCLFDDVLGLLSQGIRCAITAPEGQRLIPCDLSSIESRVLGYLANCGRINRTFAEGLDTYKDFATELFRCPYDEVTKGQRKYAKPTVLGAGYGLGGPGLVEYAEGYGVAMSKEEAQDAINLWREVNPEVPAMWYWLLDTCKEVVQGGGRREGYGVTIHRDPNFLMIDLPSGRSLHYCQPLVLPRVPPWELDKPEDEQKTRPTLTYMGMDQYTHTWKRVSTHGGKITENIVQAVARDVLGWHMREIEKRLGPVVRGHVHDEAIILVNADCAEHVLPEIEEIMSLPPLWAPGLRLGAKGFITKRYRKE